MAGQDRLRPHSLPRSQDQNPLGMQEGAQALNMALEDHLRLLAHHCLQRSQPDLINLFCAL